MCLDNAIFVDYWNGFYGGLCYNTYCNPPILYIANPIFLLYPIKEYLLWKRQHMTDAVSFFDFYAQPHAEEI